MTYPLVGPRARVEAILFSALGHDGSGSPTDQRSLGDIVDPVTSATKSRFRPAAHHGWLRDVAQIGPTFDRAVETNWPRMGDTPGPDNPYNVTRNKLVRLVVTVGYVYGPALSQFAYLWPNETADAVVELPSDRAQGDGERLKIALEYPGLYHLAPATDPFITGITREGDTEWVDLGMGRSVGVTIFRVGLRLSGVYEP